MLTQTSNVCQTEGDVKVEINALMTKTFWVKFCSLAQQHLHQLETFKVSKTLKVWPFFYSLIKNQ
ncbi:MAG: hypothetical protein DRR19_09935 [Candidatus Parabeggiatoa sp. nov. 1]|nr:MAG: hypothetical protein DRR19_09935 [Gammaproteobacteria bacterium]